MTSDSVVRARIDKDIKDQAIVALAEMGLSISDAIRLLLTRVAAEKAMPFPIRVPNAATRTAMTELARGEGQRMTREALFKDLGL